VSPRPRVLMVVNTEGLQVRRAQAFGQYLAEEVVIRVLPEPAFGALLKAREADLIYVIDPGRRGFPAALVGRLLRKPVVVEVGDPQAALYRAQGRSRAGIALGALADRLVARHSTAVVVRGRNLAEILGIRVPWVEIPDGVDLQAFRPGTDGDLRQKLGVPAEALVVGLVGSLDWAEGAGLVYGWDVVEALGLLQGEPVWGVLVGDGSGTTRLRHRAAELGVSDRLRIVGRVPHPQVPGYINAMDVCVSTQSNDEIGRGRTTAKLPEYLACDRFVLATAVGAAADVLPPEMLLSYEGRRDASYPHRLATRLRELAPRREELRRGAGTRRLAVERYGYEMLAHRLVDFLERAGLPKATLT
jgi:glycosyltransferase involved in cell wall biosynthesis